MARHSFTIKFEDLTKDLITHLLGFQENGDEEENFERSYNYVMSNLLYHHCLDTNSHKIKRMLEGILQKIHIHGQLQKAEKLLTLVDSLSDNKQLEEKEDLKWSLVSFLLHLSTKPASHFGTNEVKYGLHEVQNSDSKELIEHQIDWQDLLGVETKKNYEEDPLSDWSDDSSDEFKSGSYINSETKNDKLTLSKEIDTSEYNEKLETSGTYNQLNSIQKPYWNEDEMVTYKDCITMNPAALVVNIDKIPELNEWLLIRECLWLLMCPKIGFVFDDVKKGQFCVRKITIPSLSDSCVQNVLSTFGIGAYKLHEIRDWLTDIHKLAIGHKMSGVLFAYAQALECWRNEFLQLVVKIEKDVIKESESMSLLQVLHVLQPSLDAIHAIHTIHLQSRLYHCHSDDSYACAFRLLSCLCKSVHDYQSNLVHVIVLLLMQSLRFIFKCITKLFEADAIECKIYCEFGIHRNSCITTRDEEYWQKSYSVVQYDGIDIESFSLLKNLQSEVLEICRMKEILCELRCRGTQRVISNIFVDEAKQSCVHGVETGIDAEKFIISELQEICDISEDILCTKSSIDEEKKIVESNSNSDLTANIVSANINDLKLSKGQSKFKGEKTAGELMQMAFQMAMQHSFEEKNAKEMDKFTKLVLALPIERCFTLDLLLSDIMLALLKKRKEALGFQLIMEFSSMGLGRHIELILALILFDGAEFYDISNYLYNKALLQEELTEIDINFQLQCCLEHTFSDISKYCFFSLPSNSKPHCLSTNTLNSTITMEMLPLNRYSLNFKKLPVQELDGSYLNNMISSMSFSYQPPWPANLFLSSSLIRKYNQLMQFNLLMNTNVFTLERLKFKYIGSNLFITKEEMAVESDESDCTSEENSPLNTSENIGENLHRLYMLRHWLLFLSKTLQDYFAKNVFLPLRESLMKLFTNHNSLGQLLREHESLLNKACGHCMIKEDSPSVLKIMLIKLLSISERVLRVWHSAWSASLSETLDALEEEYSAVHRRMVNVIARVNNTHYWHTLESLEEILLHSCPA